MSDTSGKRAAARYVHRAALYESDDEFLTLVLPFLREGLEAEEPTFLVVEPAREALVRAELDDPAALTCLVRSEYFVDPLVTLRASFELFSSSTPQDGSGTVRVVGETYLGDESGWDGWGRYEALVNHFYAELPVSSLCPYDCRTTPVAVLDDVARTHRELLSVHADAVPNDRYLEPSQYLTARADAELDPLEQGSPQLVRRSPSLGEARAAVGALARSVPLEEETVFGLVLAVNEAIVNAEAHGRPPAELRAWAGPDRVVVTVRDRGPGPASPFVGLLRDPGEGRLGLWLSNRLCSRVTLTSDVDGFTVHLVAGTAQPLQPIGTSFSGPGLSPMP